jgi:hypothetical protein
MSLNALAPHTTISRILITFILTIIGLCSLRAAPQCEGSHNRFIFKAERVPVAMEEAAQVDTLHSPVLIPSPCNDPHRVCVCTTIPQTYFIRAHIFLQQHQKQHSFPLTALGIEMTIPRPPPEPPPLYSNTISLRITTSTTSTQRYARALLMPTMHTHTGQALYYPNNRLQRQQ